MTLHKVLIFSLVLLGISSCSPKIGNKITFQKVGEIYIGQTYEETVRILGAPYKKESYEDIYVKYKQFGYNPEKILVFYQGFDFTTEYDETTNRSVEPIFKLYFKNNKVHYIIMSSYAYRIVEEKYKWNDIQIFGRREQLLDQLGRDYYFEDFSPNEYDGEYFYFEKGFSLISENGQVRVVHIFPKMKQKQVEKYKRWRTIEIW